MAAWHYDLFLVATGSIETEALKSRLSRDLVPLKSPSQKLLLWGAVEGDRIDFWSDHEPAQLLARFDLRSPSESFRRLVLELAREFLFQLVNGDDVEIAANEAALLADMRSSAAQAAAAHPESEDDEDDE
ncbi:hypothetical protein AYO47_02565 [Planctomyces sp. SCGC AG-212-M04]|nr:hypothetical protein AYO47_02565 [Planctomyces sp. SCGC AG-212-M04]